MNPRRLVLAIALLVLGLAVAWVWRDHLRPSAQGGGLKNVSGRAGIVVRTPDGKEQDLGKVAGKITVIHFWATWCAPCLEELPGLAEFQKAYAGRPGFSLYAIATDTEGWPKIGPFLESNRFDLGGRVFLDPGGAVAERFGTTKYPETYIVDAAGKVLEKVDGAVDWAKPEVRAFFDQKLAE